MLVFALICSMKVSRPRRVEGCAQGGESSRILGDQILDRKIFPTHSSKCAEIGQFVDSEPPEFGGGVVMVGALYFR